VDLLVRLRGVLTTLFGRDEQSGLGRDKDLLSRDNLSESRPVSASLHTRTGPRQTSLKPRQQPDALDVELQAKQHHDRQAGAHSASGLQGVRSQEISAAAPGHTSELLGRRPAQGKKDVRVFKLDPQNLRRDSDLLGESLAVSKTILRPEELPKRPYNEVLISPKRAGRQEASEPGAVPGDLPHYMVPKARFPQFNQKLQTHHMMSKEEKADVKHRQMLLDHEKKVYQVSRMRPADKVQVRPGDAVRDRALAQQRRGQDHPGHAARRQPRHGLHRRLRPGLPLINCNSRMDEAKYDGVLISMLQEGKSYETFFDHLFGFLRRKTDFFSDWSETH
jgi:N-terminal conserved domain of Nudc.